MVIELRQNEDLEQLLERSKTDPVLIFKHSTQCPISAQAYSEFEQFIRAAPDVACGVVLVIENRGISNAIASKLGVQHESPQAIFVENGQSVWFASHWWITAETLQQAVRK